MQPDQQAVTEHNGYRSDGVAAPLTGPRHPSDAGGVGVPQDDLRPGGENFTRPDLSDRIAARREMYRQRQENSTTEPDEPPLPEADFEAFMAKVAQSDAAHEQPVLPSTVTAKRRGGPVAKAPRKKPTPKTPPKPKPAPSSTQIEDISDEELLADAGIVPIYTTTEAAQFFDKTNQWLYWGLRREINGEPITPVFIYPDGTPIEPERIGGDDGRRRFTLPIIKDILLSNYRRGNVEPEKLKQVLRRIRINELGGEWREREGWHKIRGKWVHPDNCEEVDGKWVKKQGVDDDE